MLKNNRLRLNQMTLNIMTTNYLGKFYLDYRPKTVKLLIGDAIFELTPGLHEKYQ